METQERARANDTAYPRFEAWPEKAKKDLDAEWQKDFGAKSRLVVAAMTKTQEELVEMARAEPKVAMGALEMFEEHQKAAEAIAEVAQGAVARMTIALHEAHGLPWDDEDSEAGQ